MKKVIKKFLKPVYNFMVNPHQRDILSKSVLRYMLLPTPNRKDDILSLVMGFANFTGPKGDYLEFGVWKGGSLCSAFYQAKRYKNLQEMRFYAFDSFEGLPSVEGLDAQSKDFSQGEYACSLEGVKANLKDWGVDTNRFDFIKGWFKDTLNEETRKKLKIKTAAVVYIDSDLYESAQLVLDFITPYISDGTILIFDDWYCFRGHPDRGEQKAFREWLEKNQKWQAISYHQFGWMGNSFIINEK